jgi:biotin-dependent carboxylase-like uncharacterized protein
VTPTLGVVTPGLRTTVQDLGRLGYQSFGIGVSGALDPVSLRAANALVGNPLGAGTLEVSYMGPTLAVEAEEVRFAFVGAQAAIEMLPDITAVNGRRVATLQSVRVRRGEAVRVGSLSGGTVLYIAVEGGFDIAPVLGSLSTDTRGRFGGWQGRALLANDRLPLARMRPSDREDLRLDDFDLALPPRFRVILGPQHDYFSDSAIATFFGSEYTVSAHSDHIGMRLDGPPLYQAKDVGFVSDGTAPGSIQVTGTGQPIVLMPDRQTTGGYPKIATIISADLPALGRLPIGAKIAFESVSVEVAKILRRELFAAIEAICEKLVPFGPSETDVSPMLLGSNLISGVVDAAAGESSRIGHSSFSNSSESVEERR